MSALVISPHLDDAVLSFGGAIATEPGTHVATVFAGFPPEWSWPSPFDNACGFTSSREAVRVRRREDADATTRLAAWPMHLPFHDGQYGLDQKADAIVTVVASLSLQHDPVVFPLGLAHPDHRLVAKSCQMAGAIFPGRTFAVYADLPSAVLWPGHVPGALRGWERAGWELEPFEWRTDVGRKREAYECYKSQLRFPELAWDNVTEERGWLARFTG